VPSYLQFSLEHLVKEQGKFREQFATAFSNPAAAFEFYQSQARQNMVLFEQAMSMWTSFGAAAGVAKPVMPGSAEALKAGKPGEPAAPPRDELGDLKAQLAAMQQKIEKLSQTR
jgi:polyhydroxyalkanoate synthesis regulator protein